MEGITYMPKPKTPRTSGHYYADNWSRSVGYYGWKDETIKHEWLLRNSKTIAAYLPSLSRLMNAMLLSAINDLKSLRTTNKRSAIRWIKADDEYILSFNNCCFVLGIDAQAARRRLLNAQ